MRMRTPLANAISPASSSQGTTLGAVGQRARCKVIGDRPTCQAGSCTITRLDGICRALPPDRMLHRSRFRTEYQSVREREGRASTSSEYYPVLPFRDLTGCKRGQRAIRARTFAHFDYQILLRIAARNPRGADLLGIGARFPAKMDRLPVASRQFDAVICNASFHYSVDYEVTLAESLGYLVVIADSPIYRRAESGEQKIEERKVDFRGRFGFSSDSRPSKEYLTPQILSDLSRPLSFKWQREKPWYRLAWSLRPLKAWMLGKGEPSKFYLLWARVEQ